MVNLADLPVSFVFALTRRVLSVRCVVFRLGFFLGACTMIITGALRLGPIFLFFSAVTMVTCGAATVSVVFARIRHVFSLRCVVFRLGFFLGACTMIITGALRLGPILLFFSAVTMVTCGAATVSVVFARIRHVFSRTLCCAM